METHSDFARLLAEIDRRAGRHPHAAPARPCDSPARPRRRRAARWRWRWRLSATRVQTLIVLAMALGALAWRLGAEGPPAPRLPQITDSARVLPGRVTHVRDGDTIVVAGQPIRLASLNCAERGTPDGEAATRRMQALVAGRQLRCQLTGRRSYDRLIASCQLPDGRDIDEIMLAEGICRRF